MSDERCGSIIIGRNDCLGRKRDGSHCLDEAPADAPKKKSFSRGRNIPRLPFQRYRWKGAIFGSGYPDLCALRKGQPYQPRQEGKLVEDENKDMRQRSNRRNIYGETGR